MKDSEFTPIGSAHIRAVAYNKETQDLHVRFLNGKEYAYAGVSPEKHQEFLSSTSKGKYLEQSIKRHHTARKVG